MRLRYFCFVQRLAMKLISVFNFLFNSPSPVSQSPKQEQINKVEHARLGFTTCKHSFFLEARILNFRAFRRRASLILDLGRGELGKSIEHQPNFQFQKLNELKKLLLNEFQLILITQSKPLFIHLNLLLINDPLELSFSFKYLSYCMEIIVYYGNTFRAGTVYKRGERF